MRKILTNMALALLLGASPALATQGSVNLASPTGTVQTTSDATATNLINIGALCGAASATLYQACAFQVQVNSSGQLSISGPVTNAGTFAVQFNATPSLANGNGVVPTQGGAVLSATNGMFANQLQSNAVLSVTNPAFTAISDGTTKATVNSGDGGLTVHVANTNANGQAAAGSSSPVVLPAAQVTVDPCTLSAKTNLAVSTNATPLTQIIAASGSNKIYICSIALIAPGATAFNLNTGTATNCGTSTAALIGSTTAANGMSFVANGGITLGNGTGTVAVSAASSALCTLQSNAVQVAGNITYVQAP